ncbi:transposase [Teredinibacter turnerae]|uniref:transposase n=1 Tax=Teredinibacter turnerae TaxID=2426 RepID=UPI0003F7D3E9|nr:transposase [Teredinibacter turnerae]
MAHYKQGNDKQGEFVAVIPEEQITEGSFEATACLIVDHVLDLSSFESDFNNDAGGASAYSPGTLLKVILSAYHRGITSSRKIEHLCRYNTVFMALSSFLTPDHSTIAAFVSKNPQRLEGIFIEIFNVLIGCRFTFKAISSKPFWLVCIAEKDINQEDNPVLLSLRARSPESLPTQARS